MGALDETDIDQFIRGRKDKLQQERQQLSTLPQEPIGYPPHQQDPPQNNRKQWDRGQARDTRLAEEYQAPAVPEQTGLPLAESDYDLRKQQLQSERQQEYNDLLAKKGPGRSRRPRTPANEGLPLGQYDKKRLALQKERNTEMKQELAKQPPGKSGAGVYDYRTAEREHMEEKRREYNDYLLQQQNRKGGRHIITPEQGMFVGADQAERNKQKRERNIQYKKGLEKQYENEILIRARQEGVVPYPSPRQNPPPLLQQAYDHNLRTVPAQQYFKPEVPGLDIPKTSPRKPQHQSQSDPRAINNRDTVQKRPPIYKENDTEHDNYSNDLHKGQGRSQGRGQRGRPRSRDDFHLDLTDKEKYQWYNEGKLSPPVDVRRSRSYSPTLNRERSEVQRSRSPEEVRLREQIEELRKPPQARAAKSRVSPRGPVQGQPRGLVPNRAQQQEQAQRMYEVQIAQKQQLLQDQARRELEQQQQLTNDHDGNRNNNYGEHNKRAQLDEDRKKEYQAYLAQIPPKLSLREKEVTPESLRQGLPLDQGRHDQERQHLQSERHREYNELLQKQQGTVVREELPVPPDGGGLEIGQYELAQRRLAEERKQEYINRMAEKTWNPKRGWLEPDYETFHDNFGRKNPRTDNFNVERQREYQLHLQLQQPKNRGQEVLEGTGGTLPVGEYDNAHRREQLQEERHNEYLQLQQQKLGTERQQGLPPKPPTPNHFFKNVGQHDKKTQALNEERKKEYNQKIAGDRLRTGQRGQAGAEQQNGAIPLNRSERSDSAEVRKAQTRNDEYNEFLREKRVKDAHRFDNKKPPTRAGRHNSLPSSPRRSPRGKKKEVAGLLPGLNYSGSAEKRKVQERNKEYNEFLRQKQGAKQGWATPTYEDILEQKRREELALRQEEFEPPRVKRYGSEGALNRLEDDYRGKVLDKEYEARKVRFNEDREASKGILEDDNWLRPERREQEYQELTEPPPAPEPMAARVRQPHYNASLNLGAGAVPGLAGDERDSAKRRKQGEYRRELQLQMEEGKAARKREKVQGLNVNASGLLDPERSAFRMRGLGNATGVSPRRQYESNKVKPYHTKFLQFDDGDYDALGPRGGGATRIQSVPAGGSGGGRGGGLGLGLAGLGGLGSEDNEPRGQPSAPRGILANGADISDDGGYDLGGGGGGQRSDRGRRRDRDAGILDTGFAALLEPRRNQGIANPPPGILYQPSFHAADTDKRTYVTGGGGGGLGGVNSSIDEAYFSYGLKNPLDTGDVGGSYGGGVPNLNLGGGGGGGGQYRGNSPTPRVTFADNGPPSYRKRDRSQERISPYQFPTDDDNRSRSRTDTNTYAAELERQIAEKRYKKQQEKAEIQRQERKLEEEIKNYNPFGRGGGGAPMKDGAGNAITDLRSVVRGGGPPSSRRSPVYSPRPPSPRDDLFGPPPDQQNVTGDKIYARGGHGIFGQPKTVAEKDNSDKYKDELKEQIAEKRRRAQMEKEREKMEEEKENRRLAAERDLMKEEFAAEQQKIRSREEEARRKNEELKAAAEEKKKDADMKRREADDKRMREQQERMDREQQDRERQADSNRIKSPPVPAMKAKGGNSSHTYYAYYQTDDQRASSPPVPAMRRDQKSPTRDIPSARSRGSNRSKQPSPAPGPSTQRPNSSNVLTQLASMRKQLENERLRVEHALENSKNEPDVFDPRTVQRPPANNLVFENALKKNASLPPPRATTETPNTRNIQQFNELKFKTDSESRRAFRSMFPEAPVTNTTLEAQQDAMLRQQEDHLRGLKDRNTYEPPPSTRLGYGRLGNVSARSHLPSNSAFIDVDGVNHFPEDFEDMPGVRNDDARARRRDRYSPRGGVSVMNGMGSQASLNVDRIQRENDERLRKLQYMTTTGGDDISMADPDDILDRFMAKQRYQRPPSGQTLQDDTWMRPGSKVI